MSKRDEYQNQMEEQLALWAARLDTLANKASTAVRRQLDAEIGQWRASGEAAAAKLTQLRAAAGDSWDTIKLEMEALWKTISAALDQAEAQRRTQEDNLAGRDAAAPVDSPPPTSAPSA